MSLDQEMHFGDFLFRKLQPRGRARQRFQTARNVILDRHALADVVQQQCKNQQVAPVNRSPQRLKMLRSLVRWIGQLLQMLDGAQRMLIDRISMIKVAHDQRIDPAELRQNLREQSQSLHRP